MWFLQLTAWIFQILGCESFEWTGLATGLLTELGAVIKFSHFSSHPRVSMSNNFIPFLIPMSGHKMFRNVKCLSYWAKCPPRQSIICLELSHVDMEFTDIYVLLYTSLLTIKNMWHSLLRGRISIACAISISVTHDQKYINILYSHRTNHKDNVQNVILTKGFIHYKCSLYKSAFIKCLPVFSRSPRSPRWTVSRV